MGQGAGSKTVRLPAPRSPLPFNKKKRLLPPGQESPISSSWSACYPRGAGCKLRTAISCRAFSSRRTKTSDLSFFSPMTRVSRDAKRSANLLIDDAAVTSYRNRSSAVRNRSFAHNHSSARSSSSIRSSTNCGDRGTGPSGPRVSSNVACSSSKHNRSSAHKHSSARNRSLVRKRSSTHKHSSARSSS